MPITPKILAFAGSLRADSFNKKLVKIAAQGARAAGAKITYLDLRDYPLPVFDHGQALVSAAASKRLHYAEQRARRIQAAEARIPVLAQRVLTQQARMESLEQEVIPRAERALSDLSRAGERQLVPLTDVIQARRTLNDLLLDDADSTSDAFQAALALIAETPVATFETSEPATAPSSEPPTQESTHS